MRIESLSELITNQVICHSRPAYQITTLYKSSDTPAKATAAIKRSLPHLLNVIVDANWRRKNIVGSFQIFVFLDDPGSRYRPFNEALPVASAQDSFHHHSILLVEPWIADRINVRFALKEPDDPVLDPESSALRKKIMQQSSRKPLQPDRFARKHLGKTAVRSCLIQYLPTISDLERAAMYASKSASRLSHLFPDDYLHILPQGF